MDKTFEDRVMEYYFAHINEDNDLSGGIETAIAIEFNITLETAEYIIMSRFVDYHL